MSLYKTLLWPHLEHCGPFWRLHLKHKMEKYKGGQSGGWRGWRTFPVRNSWSAGFLNRHKRQLRRDMIGVYKIMHREEKMDRRTVFSLSSPVKFLN